MDVRCERCRTEYEFEDSQISEAGVTVKCTVCGHVFKVKKKALVVTVAVKPEDATQVVPASQVAGATQVVAPQPAGAAAPEKTREWKVRQSNGNVFNFKELTTLQKWIVERKVSRDDEISLTGESWKRLGNIAELASFFQVVEAADRAAASAAAQAYPAAYSQQPAYGAYPTYAPPAMPAVAPTPPMPAAPMPANGSGAYTGAAAAQAEPPPPAYEAPQPPAAAPRAADPAWTSQPDHDLDPEELAAVKGSGKGKWVLLLAFLAGLGIAGWFVAGPSGPFPLLSRRGPEAAKAPEAAPPPAPPAAPAPAPAVAEPTPAVAEPVPAAAAEPAIVAAPEPVKTEEPPAPPAEPVPAEPAPEPKAEKPAKVARSFDWYIQQGLRKRERDQPEAALELYEKAGELEPNNPEVHTGMGYCYFDLHRLPAAQSSFQKALAGNPRFHDAIIGLAETYREMNEKKKAIETYKRYLDEAPEGPEANLAKANIERLSKE